jgi:hypothetical protein
MLITVSTVLVHKMPTKGFKSITLKEEVYNNYKKAVEDLNKMSSSKVTLSEFLEWLLDVHMRWSLSIPRLSRWGGEISSGKMSIMDSKEAKVVDVQIKDDSLYCLSCKSEQCIHTGFTYALPEVSRFLNLISKKPHPMVDRDKEE